MSKFQNVLVHIAACHLENLAEERDMNGGEGFGSDDIVENLMMESPKDWEAYGLSPRSARRVSRDAARRAVWVILQLPEWERYEKAHPGMEIPVNRIRYCTDDELVARGIAV